MPPLPFLAIILCLCLSLLGLKSLHLFAAQNGLLSQLERAITQKLTPGGSPLRTKTTNGRFPGLDLQLRAVAAFLLIFCEDWTHVDADLVGFSFATSWGASWGLIVLESLRGYSESRFMDWIAVPGLLIFNQSHAVFTSLYLAVRLAFAASCATAESLEVSVADLAALPWSFVLGYVFPMFAMTLPGISVLGANTKHVLASWYQQWNLFISAFHLLLATYWRDDRRLAGEELLVQLQPVYAFLFGLAVASIWVPIIICLLASIPDLGFGARLRRKLRMRSVFLPASPWSLVKCQDIFEGGKWLLQWDGLIGGIATAVWAATLYAEGRATVTPSQPWAAIYMRSVWYLVLGGPVGVATGLLWERDMLLLQNGRAFT